MKSATKPSESIYYDFITLAIIIGLFSIDFFPSFSANEIIEPQFLYLAFLNLIGGFFIYFNSNIVLQGCVQGFKNSSIFKFYAVFIILCCVSVFTSCNVSVSVISLTRLLLVFGLFLILSVLLYNRLYLIDKIISIIIVATFFQAFLAFSDLVKDWFSSSIAIGLSNLKGNTGNINIFASSLCIKIPFVLFGIISINKWKKGLSFITLFMASCCVFLTASRAMFIGLLLEIIVFFIGYIYLIRKKSKQLIPICFVLIASFGLSTYILNHSDAYNRKSAVSRLENVSQDASANARLTMWKNAAKITKNYPLTGIGLGNWKVEFLGYGKYLYTGTVVSTHAHNDFIEVCVETGLVNGLLFLILIVSIVYINLKRILGNEDRHTKRIAWLVVLILTVYTIDSFLNFPLYRPTIQLLFCFGIVLTVVNSKTIKHNELPRPIIQSKILSLFLIIISVCGIYFNYFSFKASQLERNIIEDQELPAEVILNRLPKYPNIGIHGTPFIEYLGIKYFVNKDFTRAFECFKEGKKINPYSYSDYYRSSIFEELGQIDSAYYYIKKSFSYRPRYEEYYKSILRIAALKKDTTNILKIHSEYNTYSKLPTDWIVSSEALYKAKFPIPKIIRFLDSGLNEFPGNNKIIQQKLLYQAQMYFDKKEFNRAINIYTGIIKQYPDNVFSVYNIGICYINLGQYKQALKYLEKTVGASGLDTNEIEKLIKLCKQLS